MSLRLLIAPLVMTVAALLLAQCAPVPDPFEEFAGVGYPTDHHSEGCEYYDSFTREIPAQFSEGTNVDPLSHVDVWISSYARTRFPQQLSELELMAERYAIESDVVPNFVLFRLPFSEEVENFQFNVEGALERALGCQTFSGHQRVALLVTAFSRRASEYQLLPVADWATQVNPEALEALASLEAECRELTPYEALIRFGVPMVRRPDGVVEVRFDRDDSCRLATRSYAYSFLISGPDSNLVVTNIYGQIFLEGIE
jgi:hypothetical protein